MKEVVLFNVLQGLIGSYSLPNPMIFFHILYAVVDWDFATARCSLDRGGCICYLQIWQMLRLQQCIKGDR